MIGLRDTAWGACACVEHFSGPRGQSDTPPKVTHAAFSRVRDEIVACAAADVLIFDFKRRDSSVCTRRSQGCVGWKGTLYSYQQQTCT